MSEDGFRSPKTGTAGSNSTHEMYISPRCFLSCHVTTEALSCSSPDP
jgi:hypothetical protein